MQLSFDGVAKRFGGLRVIDDFSHTFTQGELVALVGPSGCGKSTLLHIAAGLEKPSAGAVLTDGQPVTGPHPERMLMFQENALYPWLTLVQNVALALELQKVDRKTARARAIAWLARVSLAGFEDFYPHQVSGGMRQRAALARAFIAEPKALLLDEPFGALDALTRLTLQDVLRDLIREQAPTVLLVTHDVDEALFLADHILVFSPRPARVLKAFSLAHEETPGRPKFPHTPSGGLTRSGRSGGTHPEKTHDLSGFAATRREILGLLGIHAGHTAPESITEGADA